VTNEDEISALDQQDQQDQQGQQEQAQPDQPAASLPESCELKTLAIPMPETCETDVTLYCQQGPDGRWRSGYKVARRYDCQGRPAGDEDLPGTPDDDEGYASVADCIRCGAERANWWVSENSEADDANANAAGDALDDWLVEFDMRPTSAAEGIFDGDGEEQPAATETPMATETPAAPAAEQNLPPDPVTPQPVGSIVTDEAQRHFEARRHKLEETIGKLAIEQASLKVSVKRVRESLAEYTELLEEHLTRGPERLPLFDRPQTMPIADIVVSDTAETAAAETTTEPEAAGEPLVADTTPVADRDPAGPWREVSIEDLGIPPGICKILREEHEITTLGGIADWSSSGNSLTSLKKIGESKAAKIEEAMDRYWAAHPDHNAQ
jgi:hypothetical protein